MEQCTQCVIRLAAMSNEPWAAPCCTLLYPAIHCWLYPRISPRLIIQFDISNGQDHCCAAHSWLSIKGAAEWELLRIQYLPSTLSTDKRSIDISNTFQWRAMHIRWCMHVQNINKINKDYFLHLWPWLGLPLIRLSNCSSYCSQLQDTIVAKWY